MRLKIQQPRILNGYIIQPWNYNIAARINAALEAVNGRATQHTFRGNSDLAEVARMAETALDKIGLPKGERKAAVATMVSGDKLPSAYKWSRNVVRTSVTIERGPRDWFLVAVERSEGGDPPGQPTVTISADQRVAAMAVLEKQNRIKIS